ncbi:MAG: hypothetical protein O9329_18380 [Microcystis sp. LE19-12.2C]|jgi:hypothetical protein|nr:hypothetical protein [Microcystis sp. LE19-12.2C]MCZ8085180.1 hypothetical protein [Paracoccaceae bacterium]
MARVAELSAVGSVREARERRSHLLQVEVQRLRERDEARVLRLARKAGLFEQYWTLPELFECLTAFTDARRNGRASQLKLAEDRMARVKKIESEEERKLDARRKILLGSFLLARFERFPLERERMQGEILRFLDTHKDENVRARNKAILADILGGPGGTSAETGAQ